MTTNDQFTSPKREIIYEREFREYAMYLNGELVGFAKTYPQAEEEIDRLALELISFAAGWDAAARLRGNE